MEGARGRKSERVRSGSGPTCGCEPCAVCSTPSGICDFCAPAALRGRSFALSLSLELDLSLILFSLSILLLSATCRLDYGSG